MVRFIQLVVAFSIAACLASAELTQKQKEHAAKKQAARDAKAVIKAANQAKKQLAADAKAKRKEAAQEAKEKAAEQKLITKDANQKQRRPCKYDIPNCPKKYKIFCNAPIQIKKSYKIKHGKFAPSIPFVPSTGYELSYTIIVQDMGAVGVGSYYRSIMSLGDEDAGTYVPRMAVGPFGPNFLSTKFQRYTGDGVQFCQRRSVTLEVNVAYRIRFQISEDDASSTGLRMQIYLGYKRAGEKWVAPTVVNDCEVYRTAEFFDVPWRIGKDAENAQSETYASRPPEATVSDLEYRCYNIEKRDVGRPYRTFIRETVLGNETITEAGPTVQTMDDVDANEAADETFPGGDYY